MANKDSFAGASAPAPNLDLDLSLVVPPAAPRPRRPTADRWRRGRPRVAPLCSRTAERGRKHQEQRQQHQHQHQQQEQHQQEPHAAPGRGAPGALDAVASRGLLGLLDPVQPGKACGSDTAHLSLLGYDPRT